MENSILACVLSLSILFSAPSKSQTWIPDSLFATNSLLQTGASGTEVLSNFLVQTDGKIIASGYASNASGDFNIMARFNACGFIDSAFGTDGVVIHQFEWRNQAYHFSLQQDGKILCCGTQSPTNGVSAHRPFVARYLSNGSPDTTFGFSGEQVLRFDNVSSGRFGTVLEMSDGRILCIGISSAVTHGFGAMRFLPDGSLDSTFNGDGKTLFVANTAYMPARGQLLQNGKIIIAGRIFSGAAYFAAVCFDSTGVLDSSFATNGLFMDTVALQFNFNDAYLASQIDEKIVIASNRDPANNGAEIIRLMPSGMLDPAFGTGGHVNITFPTFVCYGLKVLSSGKIMLLGQYDIGYPAGACIRLNNDGSIDSTFGTGGLNVFDIINGQGSNHVTDLIEMQGNRLLVGDAYQNINIRRYITQSNVPHISGDANQLQTTGTGLYQWFVNDSVIAFATGSTHIPDTNGIYTVELTDDLGCSYLSAPFTVSGVGIEENMFNSPFILFPNPSNSFLLINHKLNCTARILDISGRELMKLNLIGSENNKIGIDFIAPGLYLLEINDGLFRVTRKFQKI